MPFSEYDKSRMGRILAGEGDWFHAHLARLISKADPTNRARLRKAFAEEVDTVEQFLAQVTE